MCDRKPDDPCQQTFSLKGHIVNILDSVGYIVSGNDHHQLSLFSPENNK